MKKFDSNINYIINNGTVRKGSVRNIVIKRDIVCQKCGDGASDVHHIIPLCYGGRDSADNCVLLCFTCHNFVPDETVKFFKWINRSLPIVSDLTPKLLRTFNRAYKNDLSSKYPSDIENPLRYRVEQFINILYNNLNHNYKLCWRYRYHTSIWEKENLDDLFDLSLVTDCVFEKIPYKELSRQEISDNFKKLSNEERLEKIKNFIKYTDKKITLRNVAKEFCINHMSIKDTLSKCKINNLKDLLVM